VFPNLGFFFPLVTGTFTITSTLNDTTSCTLRVDKVRQFRGGTLQNETYVMAPG